MLEKNLVCVKCGKKYDIPTGKPLFLCDKCKGTLEIVFDYKKLKEKLSYNNIKRRPFNHARYIEFYPVNPKTGLASLQEGGTPLLRSKNIEKKYKLGFELYFKLELLNPTGSFKDRGSSVEVAKAIEFGAKNVICASTGNMGASVAAYSAISNLNCYIFTPKDAPKIKLEQILAYGAKVFHVDADYATVMDIVEKLSKKGFFLLGDYLYRREGTKSVGFEIMEQTDPDYIFVPVGNGTLITSLWKAVKEFNIMGFKKQKPRVSGIQAEGCSPVIRAFKKKETVKPLRNAKTVAGAIECNDPIDGENAVKAIKESRGFAETVNDDEILETRELLAREEGIFAEPSGVVGLAGILKLKDKIKEGSKVVCVITGHGLKIPRTGIKARSRNVKPNMKKIKKLIKF